MRPNRLSQRLKTKLDAFGFDALIQGVSTLVEEDGNGVERPESKVDRPDEAVSSLTPQVSHLPVDGEGERREARGERREAAVASTDEWLRQHTAPAALPAMPRTLAAALDALGCRLAQEVAKMGGAMREGDVDEAGFYLAHVNQILDLLRAIDPHGDLARELRTQNAPPDGRSWPATSWSVVEFAESPFSGLLPPDADDLFVRQLLYAAWGVTLESATG